MGNDDRYGGDDRDRAAGSPWRSERERDRGFGRDPHDRSPGSHVDYYRGGDRGQQRWGGGFESRGDYRRTARYSDQGQARSHSDNRFADPDRGYGGVDQGIGYYGEGGGSGGYEGTFGASGMAGPGFDPEFGGPRFDRQDPGHVGTHGAHPVASPYGMAQQTLTGGPGTGSSSRARAILDQHEREQGRYGQQRGQSEFDPHYHEWRNRQIESLDRDYDEYRQENASRFESEFGAWRERRGQQRQHMGRVTEHMEVVGSDGQHVGTVDKVRDGRIVLTKSDPSAGGHHHSIPCGWLDSVDDKVVLNRSSEEAMQAWRDEEANRALFEREDGGSEGPDVLGRSFSGTYRDEK
ncbi:DUF2171 domain-containing protein [Sphingosinicella sp. YJ22]|uniref:DUF2171 domain-containing protein n=1 Tax=Sphingosinicella sp. YJ22 TaxID=1104780 RepID=UPI00140D5586|nr:DUF2171 domain-containing protein [Sphingosinicella sp. YJ22]